jgi:hypothetical protein
MQLSRRPSSFRSAHAHYAPRPCADCLPVPLRPVNGATVSDYYEDSVPLDLAIRRGSRLCTHDTLSTLRCPFVLDPGHSWFLAGESLTPAATSQVDSSVAASEMVRRVWGSPERTRVRQTQSHHTYRTRETTTYISSIVPRFHWHATVPFGFRRQVSQHPRGYYSQPLLLSAGIP